MSKILTQLISAQGVEMIDHWVAKYPSDQKQSAVMAALMTVQEERGFLTPELMDAVAEYLDMPAIAVYEVASFYSMYEHNPCGKHILNVCTNISCKLQGADKIMDHLQNKLGVEVGGTTEDGRFTLRSVECLGACIGAPMMQVHKTYYENLTSESLDTILENL